MKDDAKTPVTDDQELAKVLASMNEDAAKNDDAAAPEAPAAPQAPQAPANDDVPPIPDTLPGAGSTTPPTPPVVPAPTPPPAPAVTPPPSPISPAPVGGGKLEDIKRQALEELRPIVGKLDLPAEDKFDALLLVIRSSDDQSLIQSAYDAAEGITDEAKKAQALLDVVKEIEYFSSQGK